MQSVDPRAKDGMVRRIGVVGWSDGPWLALQAVNPWKGWGSVIVNLQVSSDILLRPCSSPTGLVGPIGSDLESGRQVHDNGGEGFSKVIDQHPEEDAKCLKFTRLRIQGLYQNKQQ